MNRAEFMRELERVAPNMEGIQITDQMYKDIEYAYMFHPSISETDGKRQIAELFANYGMALIRDMIPRAKRMEKKEADLRSLRLKMQELERQIQELRTGEELEGGE